MPSTASFHTRTALHTTGAGALFGDTPHARVRAQEQSYETRLTWAQAVFGSATHSVTPRRVQHRMPHRLSRREESALQRASQSETRLTWAQALFGSPTHSVTSRRVQHCMPRRSSHREESPLQRASQREGSSSRSYSATRRYINPFLQHSQRARERGRERRALAKLRARIAKFERRVASELTCFNDTTRYLRASWERAVPEPPLWPALRIGANYCACTRYRSGIEEQHTRAPTSMSILDMCDMFSVVCTSEQRQQ